MADALDQALDLLRAGEWFLAHEVLEDVWRRSSGAERDFLQGMIHAAVALEHFRRGNVRGARSQAAKARQRLARAPVCRGVRAADWAARVSALVAGEPDAAPPQDEWPRPETACR